MTTACTPQEPNAPMSQHESTTGQAPETTVSKTPANNGTYDAYSITALEGLEAVR